MSGTLFDGGRVASRAVEEHVRRHELIEPGGEVLCLVSGGADSTCLWSVLRELGYRVSALHVDHGLRGEESDEDAAFCARELGAEVVRRAGRRQERGRAARPPLCARRAGGSARPAIRCRTRSRRSSTGSSRAATRAVIKVRREDGVVRPLLCLWREETEAYCRERGLPFRVDSSNAGDGTRAASPRGAAGARADSPGRDARTSSARSTSGASCRRRWQSCSMRRRARSASTSAAASRRCASTTGSGSSAGPVELVGEVEWGPWRDRVDPAGA